MKPEYKPRVRMFAGPNGSGKSMLKSMLKPELLGVYINPDEIEKNIAAYGFLDLLEFNTESTSEIFLNYLKSSTLLQSANLVADIEKIRFENQKIYFSDLKINSYFASVISSFIRDLLMQKAQSFSFETVMSSADKIELFKKAKKLGYKTYLYFIATESPEINISRVKYRVSQGGHNVPEDKIISRYERSLDLLSQAIRTSWRSYIFDNSGAKEFLLAEAQDGKIIEIKTEKLPAWFDKFVIKKFT